MVSKQIPSNSNEQILVPLADIEDNPYQMRAVYDGPLLNTLATSIQDLGLLQVPIARKVGESYQLAFGHRRKKAFEKLCLRGFLGYREMPLIVRALTDHEMFEVSITENIKREDLSPIDKANALKRYMDEFGATSVQAAKLFGMPEGTVRGTVRLLKLPEEAKQKVHTGQMTQRAARKILEKPETEQKRFEFKEGFDLRTQLMTLLYGRYYSEVSDELIFKKICALVETNKQLERQVELMNSQRRKRVTDHSLQRASALSR